MANEKPQPKQGKIKKKKKGLNKVGKANISQIQKELWEHCKRLTRKNYPPVCYICGKPVSGSNDHTAHFIPKSTCGAYLKYDLRNLRRCCYYDNVNLGGNGTAYYRVMVEREGQEYVDQLFRDKNKVVKAIDRYLQQLDEYRQL